MLNGSSKFPNITWKVSVWFGAVDVINRYKPHNLILHVKVGEPQFSQGVYVFLPLRYEYSSTTDYLLEITKKLIYVTVSCQSTICPSLFLSGEYYHMINLSRYFII